jgi:hypothetical protein
VVQAGLEEGVLAHGRPGGRRRDPGRNLQGDGLQLEDGVPPTPPAVSVPVRPGPSPRPWTSSRTLWAAYDRLQSDEKRRRDKAKLEAELWSHLIDDLGIPAPCECNCGCEAPSSREDPETGELLCAARMKTIRLPDGTVACSRIAARN